MSTPHKPAVVLVHGSADSPAAWQSVRALLEPSFLVHAPALPPMPAGASPAMPAFAVDLPWLTQHMAQTGARILVAHSYGGLLALHWALANPNRLDALVLAEPICWGLIREEGPRPAFAELDRCVELFEAGDPDPALRWLVDYWNGSGFWQALPERIRDALTLTAPRTCAEVRSGNQDRTTASDLQRLPDVTRLLCGTATTAESQLVQVTFAAARPSVRLAWAEGAGHQFLRTHAALIAQVVGEAALEAGVLLPAQPKVAGELA